MKSLWAYLIALALCLALPACALFDSSDDDDALEAAVYEGIYSQGIEAGMFEPCGRDEVWNITTIDVNVIRDFIDRVRAVEDNPVYARLRGVLSPKGEYVGNFITYDRQLDLTETLEVRSVQESDCR